MSTATARVDFRTALIGILDDFRATNPTLIRQTYRARPGTFNPPLAYVGLIQEPSIRHEFGNRQSRDLRGQLVLVQGVYENAETSDKLDVLADALLTYLATQHSRADATKLLQPISSEDVDLTLPQEGGGVIAYAATIVTVTLSVP